MLRIINFRPQASIEAGPSGVDAPNERQTQPDLQKPALIPSVAPDCKFAISISGSEEAHLVCDGATGQIRSRVVQAWMGRWEGGGLESPFRLGSGRVLMLELAMLL